MAKFKITKMHLPKGVNHWESRYNVIPKAIVNHITSGNKNACINWFHTPWAYASSNYLICRDGTIIEFVPIEKGAWANGTQGSSPNQPLYAGRATTPLVKEFGFTTNANLWSVSKEHEAAVGQKFTPIQIEASGWLDAYIIKEIEKKYGHKIPYNRKYVIGHNELDPVNRPGCPGPMFPWKEIMQYGEMYLKGESPKQKKKMYSVQVGLFQYKKNANKYLKGVKEKYPESKVVETYTEVK